MFCDIFIRFLYDLSAIALQLSSNKRQRALFGLTPFYFLPFIYIFMKLKEIYLPGLIYHLPVTFVKIKILKYLQQKNDYDCVCKQLADVKCEWTNSRNPDLQYRGEYLRRNYWKIPNTLLSQTGVLKQRFCDELEYYVLNTIPSR